jgi:hypothetical protein
MITRIFPLQIGCGQWQRIIDRAVHEKGRKPLVLVVPKALHESRERDCLRLGLRRADYRMITPQHAVKNSLPVGRLIIVDDVAYGNWMGLQSKLFKIVQQTERPVWIRGINLFAHMIGNP